MIYYRATIKIQRKYPENRMINKYRIKVRGTENLNMDPAKNLNV